MPVFHTKTIESILDPVAQQVIMNFHLYWVTIFFPESEKLNVCPTASSQCPNPKITFLRKE